MDASVGALELSFGLLRPSFRECQTEPSWTDQGLSDAVYFLSPVPACAFPQGRKVVVVVDAALRPRAPYEDVLRKLHLVLSQSLHPRVGRPRNEWVPFLLKEALRIVGSTAAVETLTRRPEVWKAAVLTITMR